MLKFYEDVNITDDFRETLDCLFGKELPKRWKKTDKGYQGIFDLSGFNKDDIDVGFNEYKNIITVKAKVNGNEILKTLGKSNYENEFTFEEKISDIFVNFKNGVLYIDVNLDDTCKDKKININVL